MRRKDGVHDIAARRVSRPLWLLGAALALAVQAAASPAFAEAGGRKREELTLDATTSLSLGRRLEARGDAEGAFGLYLKAVSENPDDIEALKALVGLAVRYNRAGVVLEHAERLVRLQPGDGGALVWLAASLNEKRRPEEALEALARAEKDAANPYPGLLWTQRGIACDLTGNHLEAQRAFSHAITLSPGERTLPVRVALSLALQEDYPAALRILQMQVNDPVMEQPVRETLAIIYALSGQTETALEIARTAVSGPLAGSQRGYFEALSRLSPQARAYAAHFRRIPQEEAGKDGAGGQGMAAAANPPVPATPASAAAPAVETFEVPPAVAAPAAPAPEPAPPAPLAPVADAVAEAPQPEPAATAAPAVANPAQAYWLQLASLPGRAGLEQAWAKVSADAARLVEGREPFVEQAVVKGATYFRLMLGPFSGFAEARDMAGKLGESGIKSVIRRNVADIEPLKRR